MNPHPPLDSAVPNDLLDEIEEFLEGQMDADGTPDGYQPNRAMQLYTALQEARWKR